MLVIFFPNTNSPKFSSTIIAECKGVGSVLTFIHCTEWANNNIKNKYKMIIIMMIIINNDDNNNNNQREIKGSFVVQCKLSGEERDI